MPYLNWNPGPEYASSTRPFQGCPSLAVTPGGRLWAFWLAGGINEGPENYVVLTTSGDGGKTWSPPKLVIDPPYRASEAGAWVDPEGKLWLMWNMHPSDLQRPGNQFWTMIADDPETENPHWRSPRLLALELAAFNKPTALSDGTWIFPTFSSQWATLQRTLLPPSAPIGHLSRPLITRDKGQTFQVGGELPVPDNMRNFDEYQVIERRDGTLWILSRTIPAPHGVGESVSSDGGKTWSDMVHSKIKNTATRLFVTRLQSGNLLLVKNGRIDEDAGRNRLMAFVSMDDGRTWSGGLMLDERSTVSYPDGGQTADGTIYIIYDRERTGAKEILLACFWEEDVAAGNPVSGHVRLKSIIDKATGRVDSGRNNHISEGLGIHMSVEKTPDVVPFRDGASPVLDLAPDSSHPLVVGEKIFTNRYYLFQQVPERLAGKRFVRMGFEGGALHVLTGGMIYIATPSPQRDRPHSAEAALLRQGFQKTDLPEFLSFIHPLGESQNDKTRCTIYQKQVEAGELVNLGKWGVVLF